MRTRWATAVSVLVVVASAVVVAGCGGDDPIIRQEGSPSTTGPGIAVNSPTKDGRPADPAVVAAVVDRVSDPTLAEAPVGAATVRRFYAVQLLSLGLTTEEAACAADLLVAAAGPRAEELSMVDLMGEQAGVDQSALTQCVTPSRLAELSGRPPEPGSVAGEEVRGLLVEQTMAGLRAGGLTEEEATCVADATVGSVTDEEALALLGGIALPSERLPEALTGCLTAARLEELAGG